MRARPRATAAGRAGGRALLALAVVGLAVATIPGSGPRARPAPFTVEPIAARPVLAEQAAGEPGSPGARQPALLILMDVSSSMEEADPTGGTRIGGAKDAVIDFVDTLPSDARVGLSTYPDDGGCGGGQSVIPIGPVDRTSMSARVRTLVPNGDTPTGAALQDAGEQLLASGSGPYAILLVSDGESNCEGESDPPCEVARQLGAQGVDVTVNTVGFQIGDLGRGELQCIADATAGTYVDAADGEALADAITTYSVPELSMEVTHPTTVALQPGSSNEVEIQAVVTNTGAIPAPNVQATLAFDAAFSPGSAQPRHRLGNLGAGDASSFGWTIRPTDEFVSQTVRFTARAYTRGFSTPAYEGEIRFVWSDEPIDAFDFARDGTLVVMGDSYSSGEGAPEGLSVRSDPDDGDAAKPHPDRVGAGPSWATLDPIYQVYTAESDRGGLWGNRCHRAPRHSWGAYLAQDLEVERFSLLACSGAVTSDFWSESPSHHTPSRSAQPSQLDQLEDLADPPDVVAMTIGGNDIGFTSLVLTCIFRDPCRGPAQDPFQEKLAALPGKLSTVYRSTIRVAREQAGRSVPLVIVPYPKAFPEVGSRCRTDVGITFPPANRAYLNEVVTDLNRVIEAEVRRLRETGLPISYVEGAEDAFQPAHTVCDQDQWINGLSEADESMPTLSFQLFKHSFHPNYEGYAAMAREIRAWATRGWESQVVDPPTVAAAVRPPEPSATVAVAAGGAATAGPGDSFWAEAGGFAPGSTVTLSLASRPEVVNVAVADEAGAVTAAVWVRPDFPIGSHHLVVEGIDAEGQPLVLRRSLDVRRPLPWGWWAALVLAAVTGSGAVGSWVALGARRRRTRARSQR